MDQSIYRFLEDNDKLSSPIHYYSKEQKTLIVYKTSRFDSNSQLAGECVFIDQSKGSLPIFKVKEIPFPDKINVLRKTLKTVNSFWDNQILSILCYEYHAIMACRTDKGAFIFFIDLLKLEQKETPWLFVKVPCFFDSFSKVAVCSSGREDLPLLIYLLSNRILEDEKGFSQLYCNLPATLDEKFKYYYVEHPYPFVSLIDYEPEYYFSPKYNLLLNVFIANVDDPKECSVVLVDLKNISSGKMDSYLAGYHAISFSLLNQRINFTEKALIIEILHQKKDTKKQKSVYYSTLVYVNLDTWSVYEISWELKNAVPCVKKAPLYPARAKERKIVKKPFSLLSLVYRDSYFLDLERGVKIKKDFFNYPIDKIWGEERRFLYTNFYCNSFTASQPALDLVKGYMKRCIRLVIQPICEMIVSYCFVGNNFDCHNLSVSPICNYLTSEIYPEKAQYDKVLPNKDQENDKQQKVIVFESLS